MAYFIDRRLNPKGKSLNNRQRFMHRARQQIREALQKSLAKTPIADTFQKRKLDVKNVARKSGDDSDLYTTNEPRFRLDTGKKGERDFVLPGNKIYDRGDKIKKPGNDQSAAGQQGGNNEDSVELILSRKEILDIFFEDMALPNMVRKTLADTTEFVPRRSGFASTGSPANIDVVRTARNALGRRLALKRPKNEDIAAREEEIAGLAKAGPLPQEDTARILVLKDEMEEMRARQRAVPYLDPVDTRYRLFSPQPRPHSKAVMFCLMDVSGSMGDHEKDLARRFYILLHEFLKRNYEKVEIVFIRHTDTAQVVDENTFFYANAEGGTVVSSALLKMNETIKEKYPPHEWNIYAAQASDGHNYYNDTSLCVHILKERLLPASQYFTYMEIGPEPAKPIGFRPSSHNRGYPSEDDVSSLWKGYSRTLTDHPKFAMYYVQQPEDVGRAIHRFFAREKQVAALG